MELHEIDYKVPNGKLLRLSASLDQGKIKKISITGDFFLHPEERIFALEKSLTGKTLDRITLQRVVETELADCEMVGVSAEEIVNALLKLQKDSS